MQVCGTQVSAAGVCWKFEGHGPLQGKDEVVTAGNSLALLTQQPDRGLQVVQALADNEKAAGSSARTIVWNNLAVDRSQPLQSPEGNKEVPAGCVGAVCKVSRGILSKRKLDLLESTAAPQAKKSRTAISRKKFESTSECSDETSESGEEEEGEEESESTQSTTSGEVEEVEPEPPVPQTLNWVFMPVRETGTTTWQSWPAVSTKEWKPKGIACPAKITPEACRMRGQVYWMPECRENGDWHRRGEYVAAAKVFQGRAGADEYAKQLTESEASGVHVEKKPKAKKKAGWTGGKKKDSKERDAEGEGGSSTRSWWCSKDGTRKWENRGEDK